MDLKTVKWVGSSRDDLRALPAAARRELGFDLQRVQFGERPRDWKPMSTVGPGVAEIRVKVGGAFRLLYVAKFAETVYVLHVFQKKSQRTAAMDLDVARARYRLVQRTRRER